MCTQEQWCVYCNVAPDLEEMVFDLLKMPIRGVVCICGELYPPRPSISFWRQADCQVMKRVDTSATGQEISSRRSHGERIAGELKLRSSAPQTNSLNVDMRTNMYKTQPGQDA
jgi:hypothetical protein